MGSNGMPDLSGITPVSPGVYQGNGWKYEIIDKGHSTLTLETGTYDFNNTKPTTNDGNVLRLVQCTVVVKSGATITGGWFRQMLNYGTVENSLLSNNDIENCGGTMTNCLFKCSKPPVGVANCHKLTEVNNNVFDATLLNAPSGFMGWETYYFTGTPTLKVNLPSNKEITCINGEEHYNDLTGPDSGYYTFTPKAGEDIVLNQEPYVTDLVMTTGGFPVTTGREPIYQDNDPTKQVIGCKGNGWKYENDTLTLESGSYDFTNTKPITKGGDALTFVQCEVVVEKEATITGGWFHAMLNHGTVKNSLLGSYDIINDGGTMTDCLFSRTTPPVGVANCHKLTEVNNSKFEATLLNAPSGFTGCETYYFTGTPTLRVKLSSNKEITCINGRTDYGGLKPSEDVSGYYTFTPPTEEDIVLNDTIIHEPFTMTNGYPTASNGGKTACKGEGWEYILGNPEHGDFLFLSDAQIDFSKISDGSPVECKLFIGHGVAVQGGTFNGDVINNGGGILGGTFNGAVENHGTIVNGVFNGAVTNIYPGTVSDSITGTGTLNGKPITPNAYTLTVTGGGLVNGKTSAVVEAGDEVCLTVGEMQDGMSFNYWDLPTALTKALTAEDSTFSNKVEPLTFTMLDLSGYTEDTRFTIRLDIRPAELPDDDDGPSVLGTMATVAVGGAAAGILVWQGVSLGVDSYLQLSLPGGVPVPANRRELVKLLWETAGKPDVVLPALYGDVSAEDAELQKATRWAIDNGLVKPADDSDASRFDPDRSVSKYEVARAWFKVQQMLK
ncbi:Uncharacterised protein [Faecalibacterium prausnitzii]|nr:Uncharacterised protein [Faecalibacterium prausnitzii]